MYVGEKEDRGVGREYTTHTHPVCTAVYSSRCATTGDMREESKIESETERQRDQKTLPVNSNNHDRDFDDTVLNPFHPPSPPFSSLLLPSPPVSSRLLPSPILRRPGTEPFDGL
jgi:hypothetical protein